MARSHKRKPPAHSFHISGAHNKFIREAVEVSFQPLNKKQLPLPQHKSARARSIVPTFNHDRKYYTPAFRLPASDVDPDEQAAKEHERRVYEAQLEIEDILYPKPRSKQKYCGVCKDYYEDYKEHVEDAPHLHALTNSAYHRLIKEAAERIGEQLTERPEDEKTLESSSEDQLFKCLSLESITDGSYQPSCRNPHLLRLPE